MKTLKTTPKRKYLHHELATIINFILCPSPFTNSCSKEREAALEKLSRLSCYWLVASVCFVRCTSYENRLSRYQYCTWMTTIRARWTISLFPWNSRRLVKMVQPRCQKPLDSQQQLEHTFNWAQIKNKAIDVRFAWILLACQKKITQLPRYKK